MRNRCLAMDGETLSQRQEDRAQALFSAIGEAITYWAQVERSLLDIFITAIDPGHPRAAAAAYYANINFRTKLDFVDRAVITRLSQPDISEKAWHLNFPDPLIPIWTALGKRLRKKSSKRGNVAHFEKMLFRNEWVLVPPLENPLNFAKLAADDSGNNKLTVAKIKAITTEFAEVSRALRDFDNQLLKSLGRKPKKLLTPHL